MAHYVSDVIPASPSSAPLKSNIKNLIDAIWTLDYLWPHLRDLVIKQNVELCSEGVRKVCLNNALSHLSWLIYSLPKMSFRNYHKNIPACALKTKQNMFVFIVTHYIISKFDHN